MAVLRNRYPLNIPPSGADPLLKMTNITCKSNVSLVYFRFSLRVVQRVHVQIAYAVVTPEAHLNEQDEGHIV